MACSFHFATHPAILQSRLYKMQIFNTFYIIILHIQKKSSTFAPRNLKLVRSILHTHD